MRDLTHLRVRFVERVEDQGNTFGSTQLLGGSADLRTVDRDDHGRRNCASPRATSKQASPKYTLRRVGASRSSVRSTWRHGQAHRPAFLDRQQRTGFRRRPRRRHLRIRSMSARRRPILAGQPRRSLQRSPFNPAQQDSLPAQRLQSVRQDLRRRFRRRTEPSGQSDATTTVPPFVQVGAPRTSRQR